MLMPNEPTSEAHSDKVWIIDAICIIIVTNTLHLCRSQYAFKNDRNASCCEFH
jgi:uncharacterized membrane protein YjdF